MPELNAEGNLVFRPKKPKSPASSGLPSIGAPTPPKPPQLRINAQGNVMIGGTRGPALTPGASGIPTVQRTTEGAPSAPSVTPTLGLNAKGNASFTPSNQKKDTLSSTQGTGATTVQQAPAVGSDSERITTIQSLIDRMNAARASGDTATADSLNRGIQTALQNASAGVRQHFAGLTGGGQTGGSGSLTSATSDLLSTAVSALASAGNNAQSLAALTAAWNQANLALTQAQNQVLGYLQGQTGQLDPQVQQAFAQIQAQVAAQKESILQDLANRGLLQSGFVQRAETDLANGALDAQSKILVQSIADKTGQLVDAMLDFAKQRVALFQTYGPQTVEAAKADQSLRLEGLEKAAGIVSDQAKTAADNANALQIAQGNNAVDLAKVAETQRHDVQLEAQARQRLAQDKATHGDTLTNQHLTQLMDVWDQTGVAPDGLQSLGVPPGMPKAQPPTTAPTGTDSVATNQAIGLMSSMAPKQMFELLTDPSQLKHMTDSRVDVSRLWSFYYRAINNADFSNAVNSAISGPSIQQ